MKEFNFKSLFLALIISLTLILTGCGGADTDGEDGANPPAGDVGGDAEGGDTEGGDTEGDDSEGGDTEGDDSEGDRADAPDFTAIPEYSTDAYVNVNGGVPFFSESEITSEGFVLYSDLDGLGRAVGALASIGREIMPTDARESVSHIKPSGWMYNGKSNNNTYSLLGGQTVYNRTHLLAHMLVSNDVDERNFVTGTPYMNQTTMTGFENMVCDYVKETGNHVMYRITPHFVGEELICRGLLIEAYSVEDEGDGICFCVYLYNVQPGIEIDYKTGENRLPASGGGDEAETPETPIGMPEEGRAYTLVASIGGEHRYFSSLSSSKTLSTVSDIGEATEIYFESAGSEGVYYIYYMSGSTKTYLHMSSDATKAFTTKNSTSGLSAWRIDTEKHQIVSTTHTKRAISYYADKADMRTYATSGDYVWVYFTSAE